MSILVCSYMCAGADGLVIERLVSGMVDFGVDGRRVEWDRPYGVEYSQSGIFIEVAQVSSASLVIHFKRLGASFIYHLKVLRSAPRSSSQPPPAQGRPTH